MEGFDDDPNFAQCGVRSKTSLSKLLVPRRLEKWSLAVSDVSVVGKAKIGA